MAIMSLFTSVEEASGLTKALQIFAATEGGFPPASWSPSWRAVACPECLDTGSVSQLHDPVTFKDLPGWLLCCECDVTWPEEREAQETSVAA